jgi:hypothetical protein
MNRRFDQFKRPGFRWLLLFVTMATLAAVNMACSGAEAPVPVARSVAGDAAFEEADLAVAGEPAESAPLAPSSGFVDGASVPLEAYLAGAVQAQEARVIIYTGDIALVVRDTEEAVKAITTLANENGGFVAGSNLYQSGEALRGSVTVRIPAERYQDTLTQLRDLALRVERESSSTQDVTEEFVDLQARKTNLEFTEAALQELLEERQRVGSTSDILEVHRELTNIRGQIEQIEGRLRFLANQAALSTVTVELTPDILYQPITVAGWEPQGVAKQALQALVVALQALVNILIWLIVFVLPLLVILLIPVVIVVLVIRWLWKRRQVKRAAAGGKAPSR